jgi:competence protein ComEA
MFRKLAALAIALALALPAFAATPVNINKADAATLAKSLDGIGPSKASAIVAWRDEHGPFKTVDELAQVKGVGEATLERNRSAILLSDEAPSTEAAKPATGKTNG